MLASKLCPVYACSPPSISRALLLPFFPFNLGQAAHPRTYMHQSHIHRKLPGLWGGTRRVSLASLLLLVLSHRNTKLFCMFACHRRNPVGFQNFLLCCLALPMALMLAKSPLHLSVLAKKKKKTVHGRQLSCPRGLLLHSSDVARRLWRPVLPVCGAFHTPLHENGSQSALP